MLTPFLKWVGGKRWLVESNELKFPRQYKNYIEPFLGGAAVFFSLLPKNSLLGDLNGRLVETYCVVRDEPTSLECKLAEHAAQHSEAYYYFIRSHSFSSEIERAAQFIYLNRTCFNGIYRENLKGQFNVPKGSRDTVLFNSDNFVAWSEALTNSRVLLSDFEAIIDEAGNGDLIFADPPYTVRHNQNGFVKYNQKIFSWHDQERLARSLRAAKSRGADFVLTNADHGAISELYAGFAFLKSVGRSSLVAASKSNRGQTTELIISSFDESKANSQVATDHNALLLTT